MSSASAIATVVVAHDFSDTSGAAIAWGAEIARAHGACLALCHALLPETAYAPASEFIPLPASYYDEVRSAASKQLAEAAAALRATGLRVEALLPVGPPADTVLAEATRLGADLVVAGTRGLTGWKRLLLGSTAAHLVRRAACPILTVHPEDAGRHRAPRTVLIPTDFSTDAAHACEAASRVIGTAAGSRIVLLHAYHVPAEYVAPLPVPVLLEDTAQVIAAAKVEMADVVASLRASGHEVETRVVEGYPPEVIVALAREIGADLIAMGTHGRSGVKRLFLGSTAERVLPIAPCPVLTVHRD